METKDDLATMVARANDDWSKYIATRKESDAYTILLDEIEKYLDKETMIMKLTEDKKRGIQTLLDLVHPTKDYKIGSREIGGDIIIDQLKKCLLIEGYDSTDRELLNGLRGLYTKGVLTKR